MEDQIYTARPDTSSCRTEGCKNKGYGGYCTKHTPPEGSGVTKCLGCGEPVCEHPVTGSDKCYDRVKART